MGAAICPAPVWAGDTEMRRKACREGSQVQTKCYARGNVGCRGSLEPGHMT